MTGSVGSCDGVREGVKEMDLKRRKELRWIGAGARLVCVVAHWRRMGLA